MPTEIELLRDATIATWRKFFVELLGQEEPYLSEHIAQWHDWMNDDFAGLGGWFYHETPFSYVVHTLVPNATWESLNANECRRLESALERAIIPPEEYCLHPDQLPDFNWDAVRNRVRDVLRAFSPGTSTGNE